jgi:outer membrane protein assembly factor BamB
MSPEQTNVHGDQRPLRLWPGVVLVAMQWVLWSAVPLVAPAMTLYGTLGGVLCGAFVLAWWLFFSRAPWAERIGALVVMIAGVAATSLVVHPSISNGMMGMMLPFYSIPVLCLALVVWAVVARGWSPGRRRASMVAAILVASSTFTLIRTGGISGEGMADLHWRWTITPEERLLAQAADEPPTMTARPAAPSATSVEAPSSKANAVPDAPAATATPKAEAGAGAASSASSKSAGEMANASPGSGAKVRTTDPTGARSPAEWPGFRGPRRDGVVRGVQLETDWSQKPPVELWRRPIGPGWSSFAVDGDFIYTQEQRGDDEIVSCYRLTTGEPVWRHRDAVRFWESNGGAGPRATPTLHDGRVYTMGATGVLNALDAATGAVVWTRNATADTGKTVPDWGIASSPLVFDDIVIVAVAGQLAAYDSKTGASRWMGQPGGAGYSSPHLATIDGVPQVLLLRGSRTISVAPADGTLLWEHAAGPPSTSIVQPAIAREREVLIATGDTMGANGLRSVAVTRGGTGWTVEERWLSNGLKPYFNDFVVSKGHAFGFDGSILACIDLADGTRKWKGGRYGHGQMVALPEQDLLLVLSEEGELVLVSATPDKFTEITRARGIEGKTWNHPVLVGDTLLVRNGEEMAAFRLPTSTMR